MLTLLFGHIVAAHLLTTQVIRENIVTTLEPGFAGYLVDIRKDWNYGQNIGAGVRTLNSQVSNEGDA